MTEHPRSPAVLAARIGAVAGRAVVAGLLACCASWTWAQGPSATALMKLVVPFTPGTGIDIIARTVGPKLAERLGRPVVVENRAGASGNLGTEAVVRAAPDGNTLLVTVSTLVMNRALYPGLSFDPLRDLDPISLTSWGQLLLVASPKSGLMTAADLLASARARPGVLNYGSPGVGTPHHLAMELLKKQAGVFITHIPYRGTAPAVTDLLGGQIDVMFLPIHVALPQVRAGRLIALAISSPDANPLLPNVPPLRRVGVGTIDVDMWYGILAPKGTPEEIKARLNRELKDILAQADVRAALESQGMVPAHSSAADFGALMERDATRWADLIRTQNIQPE
jgi:tripartite-type tricarboxylate transporter receptor subunit TctC